MSESKVNILSRVAYAPGLEVVAAAEARKIVFDSGGKTDVGKQREHNEDSVLGNEENFKDKGIDGLYIVADGMGGHLSGEVASAIAVDVIKQQCIKGEFPRGVQNFGQLTQEERKQWILEAVNKANSAIFLRGKTEGSDMGSTTVMAIRSGDEVAVANVGDSRAYTISKDGKVINQVTKDHSLVAKLVESGQITEEEAKVHLQRNVIYRTMGDKPKVEVDVFFAKIPSGGSMILCSDGLSGMVDDDQIRKIVISAPDSNTAASRLIDAANAAGGNDNISAIVVKNTGKMAEISGKSPERPPGSKTEKEWNDLMLEISSSPIAKTIYLQTGSLTAAAVAHEYRDEIISGRMDKVQYLDLVKRVKKAVKN